jgi:ABC-type antimicrobial peptide transport system permease subunit
MYRLLGRIYVDTIDVEASDMDVMDEASDAIKDVIIKKHDLLPRNLDSFQIRNMADIQATIKATTDTISLLLGIVALIALLVGGIGIMNIMLVSVTERTKEIGLRKAIGAQGKDILLQFLIEAVVMTFAGGIIGVILGVSISLIIGKVTGWAIIISAISIIVATAFSIAIGLIFGIFPSIKAAQLNPIEALRFE